MAFNLFGEISDGLGQLSGLTENIPVVNLITSPTGLLGGVGMLTGGLGNILGGLGGLGGGGGGGNNLWIWVIGGVVIFMVLK